MIPVSALASYLYCRRKLFLERVLKLEAPQDGKLVLGQLRHEVMASLRGIDERIVTAIDGAPDKRSLEQVFRKRYMRLARDAATSRKSLLESVGIEPVSAFHTIWEQLEGEASYRAGLISGFIRTTDTRGDALWESLVPKIRSEVALRSDELQLVGKVDQLMEYEDSFVPIEMKSGKAPKDGVWPGHKIQLGAYMMMLEGNVPHGFVQYSGGERRKVILNPFFRKELLKLRDDVASLLESTQLPDFTTNRNKCESCNLREKCHDEAFIARILQSSPLPHTARIRNL